jgi:hypothetical protein
MVRSTSVIWIPISLPFECLARLRTSGNTGRGYGVRTMARAKLVRRAPQGAKTFLGTLI